MDESETISIPSRMKKEIDNLQKILKMDKNTLIKYLLDRSIEEVKLEQALEEYRKGKISFGKAAELAQVNLWRFLEECKKHQIPLDLDKAEVESEMKKVREFDIKKYKEQLKNRDSE